MRNVCVIFGRTVVALPIFFCNASWWPRNDKLITRKCQSDSMDILQINLTAHSMSSSEINLPDYVQNLLNDTFAYLVISLFCRILCKLQCSIILVWIWELQHLRHQLQRSSRSTKKQGLHSLRLTILQCNALCQKKCHTPMTGNAQLRAPSESPLTGTSSNLS